MDDDVIRVQEKRCPRCGNDATLAWVSSDGDDDLFECRRCHTVVKYSGPW